MGDDPLLLAVEKLVKPYPMPTLQTRDDKSWVTTVVHDGLLKQLRDATEGSISSHAGGAGNDSSRLPFDAGAVALRDEIHDTVAVWVADFGETAWPIEQDERTLVAWYRLHIDAYRAGKRTDEQHGRYVRRVRDWVEAIEQIFNPPEIVPLGAACPGCGSRWALERVHGDRVDALAVSYWRAGTEAIGGVKAECRRCRREWSGRHGLHALMEAISDAERESTVLLETQLTTDTPDTGPLQIPDAT